MILLKSHNVKFRKKIAKFSRKSENQRQLERVTIIKHFVNISISLIPRRIFVQ